MGNRHHFFQILLTGALLLSKCHTSDGDISTQSYDIGCSTAELVATLRKINEIDASNTSIINLDPNCEYVLEDPATGDDGVSVLPTISSTIIINGNQATLKLIKGRDNPSLRMIFIDVDGNLKLSQLALVTDDISSFHNTPRDIFEWGGSILNKGTLSLDTVVVDGNFASWGGAIYSVGILSINNSEFIGNESDSSGGAIYSTGDIQVSGSIFTGNQTWMGHFGGAIYQEDGEMLITDSVFSTNVSGGKGLGGGAIAQIGGTLTITGSTFDSNSHEYGSSALTWDLPQNVGGGAILLMGVLFSVSNSEFNNNSTTDQGGAISISAEAQVYTPSEGGDYTEFELTDSNININPNASATIENCSFSNNEAKLKSGAIHNEMGQLTLQNSTFNNNYSEFGEGLLYHGGDQLTIDHCSFTNNQSMEDDPLLLATGDGSFLCESNLFAHNESQWGTITTNGGIDAIIRNTTVSQNNNGVISWGTMVINSSTIVQNASPGITYNPAWGSPTMTIENSIIANNSGGDCDFTSSIIALGANLDSDGSCTGFTLTDDPLLEPLADNGGQTMTHALLPNSPAISAALSACLPTDQRDSPRPSNYCDLGSYENTTVIPAVVLPSETPTPEANDRCALFEPEEMSLSILSIPAGTTTQTIYITMPNGIPGLEYEVPEDPDIWEYTATLGVTNADYCNYQGFDGRLYCSFDLPESDIGSMQPLFIFVNECNSPIYTNPSVSIIVQEIIATESPLICTATLDKERCIKAGGEYKDSPGMVAPFCDCP